MTMLAEAMVLSLIGGSGIFIGALLASHEHIRPTWLENEFRHGITAFGGGALISAVALVLIPEGIQNQSVLSVTITFLAGGLVFMSLERFLARHKTTAAQFLAMLLDFVPEAMVIGAMMTRDRYAAFLMTLFIFLQNLPESFNAFCELTHSVKTSVKKILIGFLIVACSGPIYVVVGATVFNRHEDWLAGLMTFCSGGILYILFNDIAPQVKLKRHWWPAMGALFGFLAGLLGKLFLR